MKKTWILAGLLAATLALTAACGGGEGTGGEGGSGPQSTSTASGTGGAATYGDGACRACVATSCADEIDACKADPECPSFLSCLDACPLTQAGDADPGCLSLCPTGSGTESKKAVTEINLCREKGAGAACAACGRTPQQTYSSPILNQVCPNPSTETNVCFICIDEKCCDTYQTCHDDPECEATKACLGACVAGDHACAKACTEQHPAGSDVLGPYLACGIVRCATEQVDAPCDASARDACGACFYGDCGDAYAEFLAAPGGLAMESCIDACAVDDVACDQVCYSAYPDAYEKWGALASCLGVVCKGKC